VIEAYLDVLDYSVIVDNGVFTQVLESMSFSDHIDHVLFGHVMDQMKQRGMDGRVQYSAYYLAVKGGWTTADLLTELSTDGAVDRLANSKLFKSQVLACLNDASLDSLVREKIVEALNACSHKLDAAFYGEISAQTQAKTKEE